MVAQQVREETTEALQEAEAKLKKGETEDPQKAKKQEETEKLQQALVRSPKPESHCSDDQCPVEIRRRRSGSEGSKRGLERAIRHVNLAHGKLDKVTRESKAAELALVEGTPLPKLSELANPQHPICRTVRTSTKGKFHRCVERDVTFANWPGDRRARHLPAPFRDYEVNQEMDTFELDIGRDNVVDIFFEGLCGHTWSKAEKITVASCIGNAFGWLPIGGPCWQDVRTRQDELLARPRIHLERSERHLLVPRYLTSTLCAVINQTSS